MLLLLIEYTLDTSELFYAKELLSLSIFAFHNLNRNNNQYIYRK